MKLTLISWNVNGIRAIEKKGSLTELLERESPDCLFIQEIKGNIEQFPEILVTNPEYQVFYNSAQKKGYSGTGIWIKKSLLDDNNELVFERFEKGITSKDIDHEGRVVKVFLTVKGKPYCLIGVYFPNGGKSEQAWEDKLIFYEDFLKEINRLRKKGIECIWCGDVNCAHNEIDLARPKENDGVIGFHPRERAWVDKVVKNKWMDVWRERNPEVKDVYSWWSMVTRARDKNIGWRIDYFFCDQNFFNNVESIAYLNQQMGSDHCPVKLEVSLSK